MGKERNGNERKCPEEGQQTYKYRMAPSLKSGRRQQKPITVLFPERGRRRGPVPEAVRWAATTSPLPSARKQKPLFPPGSAPGRPGWNAGQTGPGPAKCEGLQFSRELGGVRIGAVGSLLWATWSLPLSHDSSLPQDTHKRAWPCSNQTSCTKHMGWAAASPRATVSP